MIPFKSPQDQGAFQTMGEYAKFRNTEVKIGTCENMYYLRLSEVKSLKLLPLPGQIDPKKQYRSLWFRLPYPKEMNTQLFYTSVGIFTGVKFICHDIPENHGIVQVKNNAGLMVNMHCTPHTRFPKDHKLPVEPEGYRNPVLNIHRNGGMHYYSLEAIGIRHFNKTDVPAFKVTCSDCESSWGMYFNPLDQKDQQEKLDFCKFMKDAYPDLWENIIKEFAAFDLTI